MIDLVKRLRSDVQTPDCDCERCVLFREAADRIEQLERDNAALRELLKGCGVALRILTTGRKGEDYPYAQTRAGSMMEVSDVLAKIDAALP